MSEGDAVAAVDEPVTPARLASDLRDLEVAGETVIVHSSMSSLGWVPGGAQGVVGALRDAVTESGTIVVPTHTSHLCTPSVWQNPPIPDAWLPAVRESMPAFRPDATPSRGVGAVPECFRTYPDTVRSDHLQYSFAAWGADADAIVAGHELDRGLGEKSPLSAVYDRDGLVLMLGTDHETNTSLHLAETRAEYERDETVEEGPLLVDGEREWVEFADVERTTDDFPVVGAAFEDDVGVERGRVGAADAKLLDQRALVDYAAEWFSRNR
ncbi:aminoglycoside N(3)-acetyltransferase [Salarchaeum sp. JOR-1]|uniref:aminoglycoside N(3)-acetyltransferase n=1 Tax=Salarchaeum sp. JOR-1 TaxID=2599399 RepID=UPI0011984CB3|nr:AAC(3) family N-acetyltransferase [Salarchaeum sp. JOR-1]QDX41485.1 AAC(3) family N-acetyltransferase [Salarchaeum sp. JOR-1]